MAPDRFERFDPYTGEPDCLFAQRHDVRGMLNPVQCYHCGRPYDMAKVTVVARYADCSMWHCPHCNILVDDRGETGWKTTQDYIRLNGKGRHVK